MRMWMKERVCAYMSSMFGSVVIYKQFRLRYKGKDRQWEICNNKPASPDGCGAILWWGETVVDCINLIDEMQNRIEALKIKKREREGAK